ncbi:MAG: Folate carrier, cyanobacterial type [uncultured Campylobacterales bacterium]|uniref:Folate carrier, cyanobacterial type n=1 Tax=uncultured Campylobacterales bacterium TaxID=352960 RepID=A0A6S6SJS8_9BACT|nr:MAG: Folate carrier, cyanobacterial type [uncultured Campylobacterales bacterium]
MDSLNSLLLKFLLPIKSIRARYLPLLCIYFAYGASAFTSIAESFWIKSHLDLDSSELITLGVWLMIPWSIKMVFGQIVDSFSLIGSRRKGFIYLGATLILVSTLMMIDMVGEHQILPFSKEFTFILSSVIAVIGFVLQDVVADTMSTEVIDKSASKEEQKRELAIIQVLGRLALGLAGILVVGLGGIVAKHSYELVFIIALIIPFISIAGAMLVKLDTPLKSPLNNKIFFGGITFAFFVIFMGYNNFAYSQEIIFFVSLFVILFMIYELIKDLSNKQIKFMVSAIVIIFIYRAVPSVGPGLLWWEIDVLGFDEQFFGVLKQIGAVLALFGLWFMSDLIVKLSISKVLIILVLISTVLSLPILGMYYGLHEYTAAFGISARDIALIDVALDSPFDYLSMVVLLTLVAVNAPEGRKGTWFALMTSLMNLALMASGLLTKYLNKIFVISREVISDGVTISTADYSNLGILMSIVISIGFFVPVAFIYFLRK